MRRIVALLLAVVSVFALVACTQAAVTVSRLVITQPTKVEYEVGDAWDGTGLEVKAIFSDGTEKVLTAEEYTLTGFSSASAQLVTITVAYEGVTATFGVAVYNPDAPEEALAIVVKTLPDQQIYTKDEAFSAAGLQIEAIYNTGRREVLNASAYTLSGFVAGVAGSYTVTVTWGALTTSFTASVTNSVKVQGITDTTILVGNTAAISGALSFVGLPFVAGMKAAFEVVNEAGGIDGRVINYVNRDDGFNATVGITNTRQLIEEDKVFALVGHFGTGTVGSTLSMIREAGIPMVYAATGVNSLYSEVSPLDPVMPVQPIYLTDGRLMTARALKEALFGANKDEVLGSTAKVGVLYTTTDDGTSIRQGIEIEAKNLGRNANFIYSSFSATEVGSLLATVQNFQASGVQAIIVASNQSGFKAAIGQMHLAGLNVPVFTSYVNADPTAVDSATTYAFDIYTNAWVDVLSAAGQASAATFIEAINNASFLTAEEKTAYATNAYATAGYIAAQIFIEGLRRVETSGKELTWENFIKAMEAGAIDVPMGGSVDFSSGKRWGIDSMSLLKYNTTSHVFEKVREIETLSQIEAK